MERAGTQKGGVYRRQKTRKSRTMRRVAGRVRLTRQGLVQTRRRPRVGEKSVIGSLAKEAVAKGVKQDALEALEDIQVRIKLLRSIRRSKTVSADIKEKIDIFFGLLVTAMAEAAEAAEAELAVQRIALLSDDASPSDASAFLKKIEKRVEQMDDPKDMEELYTISEAMVAAFKWAAKADEEISALQTGADVEMGAVSRSRSSSGSRASAVDDDGGLSDFLDALRI